MTKPMYCPMSFQSVIVTTNPDVKPPRKIECTPDCAWAIKTCDEYFCAVAEGFAQTQIINTRPLKDDAE